MVSVQVRNKHNQRVLDTLESLIGDAKKSHEYLRDHKILDSLGKAISNWTENPTQAAIDHFRNLNSAFNDMIKTGLGRQILSIKGTQDVYAQNEDASNLHFYIVVNEDNAESRGKYYDVQDQFESSPLSEKFKAHFHFITPTLVGHLKKGSEQIKPE